MGIVTSRITDAELIVNTLSAKMALFAEMEQNVSALSQNVYFSFHVNNSMLECPPGSINFSQRLTFPQPTVPSRFIAKQDLDLPGLYLRQEPSVENSWYVSRMMVFSVSILVRQSKSQDDCEIGKRFAPLWNALSKKLQELFPESDIEGTFIVPSLDVRAQVLNIYDRRNGDVKHVFKLAPPGHDQMFATTAPRVCVSLIFLMMSCDKSYVKQALWLRIARPMCDGRPFTSSPFRRLASGGSFFCGVTLWCFFFFSNCDLGKCSCLVRSSIRHYVLLFPYCPTAW